MPELSAFSKGREIAESNELAPDYARTLPGAYKLLDDEIELNSSRPTIKLSVQNTGDRPIQVGSHYAFVETNRALVFDRGRAVGTRLDIPAGTAVRFEPGDIKTVNLVEFAGKGVIYGGNNLTDGAFRGRREEILARAVTGGFGHKDEVGS